MRPAVMMIPLVALAACETPTTKEGCPIYVSEIGRAYTEGCQRNFYEEQARQRGATITRCMGGPDDFTCITE